MEYTKEIFRAFAELRLLLTSNLDKYAAGETVLSGNIKMVYNGSYLYEFKISTVDFWIEVNWMGLPKFGIRGNVDEKYKNEFVYDSILEISKSVCDYEGI